MHCFFFVKFILSLHLKQCGLFKSTCTQNALQHTDYVTLKTWDLLFTVMDYKIQASFS